MHINVHGEQYYAFGYKRLICTHKYREQCSFDNAVAYTILTAGGYNIVLIYAYIIYTKARDEHVSSYTQTHYQMDVAFEITKIEFKSFLCIRIREKKQNYSDSEHASSLININIKTIIHVHVKTYVIYSFENRRTF